MYVFVLGRLVDKANVDICITCRQPHDKMTVLYIIDSIIDILAYNMYYRHDIIPRL